MTTSTLRANDHDASGLKALFVVFIIGYAPLATMMISWLPTTEPATIPIRLIKGYAAPVLLAELIVIVLTLSDSATRQIAVRVSPLCRSAAIGLIAIACGTAVFAAPQPIESLIRTIILAVHLLFGLSIYRLNAAGVLKPALLTHALISGFLLCFAALFLFAWQVRNVEDFNWMHDLPGFVNIRNLGYYAAPVAALMFARLALSEDRARLIWNFVCSTASVGLIFWSGSRGAIAALGATYIVAALFFPVLRNTRAWGHAFLACVTGGLLAHAIGSPMAGMGIERMAQIEAFSSGRIELWISSIGPIVERPLFGYGEGQTIRVVPFAQENRIFSPHNILIQTLLAWGIAGTLLLAGLACSFVRRVLATVRQGNDTLPLVMALLAIASYSLIDGTLYYTLTTAIFAACTGSLLAASPGAAKRSPSPA